MLRKVSLYTVRPETNMKADCLAAWLIVGLLSASALQAQTTTQVTINFSGTVNGVNNGSAGFAQFAAVGNIAPFGAATLAGTVGFVNNGATQVVPRPFTFILANGDSIRIGPNGFGCCGFIEFDSFGMPDSILGGTGIFSKATGSLQLGPTQQPLCFPTPPGDEKPVCPVAFLLTGSGSITTAGLISVSPSALPFSFLQGNPAPSSLSITLTNGTSQSAMFSATTSGQSWLGVSQSNPTATAFSSISAIVTVDPSGLSPGTFAGSVTLAGSSKSFVVPVNVTVSSAELAIAISQTSLRFQVAAGGSPPPNQSITVLNQGTGSLNWSAKASTLVGSWLSVTPSSGTAGDAATVSIDPTNLAPGDYYGLVRFTATGAANSPQAAVIVLNVLPASTAVPTAEPTGLIFVGQQGSSNPAFQTVTVSNPSSQSITVTPTPLAQQNGVFAVTPTGSTSVTSQGAQFMISADLTGLTAGVYTGAIQFVFGDGSIQQVALALIVTPPGGAAAVPARIRLASTTSGCTPTQLIPVSTALGESFTQVAAWPTPLVVQVVDDCGNPMGPGTVVASFSTGDPPLSLVSLGGGVWSGTWEPCYIANAAARL